MAALSPDSAKLSAGRMQQPSISTGMFLAMAVALVAWGAAGALVIVCLLR